MSARTLTAGFATLLLSGAIFGFFYAWICSTMWGLDTLDPRIAMAAMQAMNDSVRNAVFAPAFFATPVVAGLAAGLALRDGAPRAALAFAAAALVYLLGGMGLTMAVNVPMNEALASREVPSDIDTARAIWQDYSPRWQRFNTLRTLASGVALMLSGYGLVALARA
ncbi:anthrone oxygenase family protein [Pseudoponticoccus marisrubri]|uniref:DUF1772 domain-containing protein n=1 Tax=Pseudoponticoccus marisrubri TaxID=1685382 RepID=A0A0W7WES5_9RHOB|nr:anthrone oxygenase family protein [Pseudoponticoccus marisrubri]KUF09147.1 hypothetical protein AVJ23_18905 [Pseudoponticoccus marisrubri]